MTEFSSLDELILQTDERKRFKNLMDESKNVRPLCLMSLWQICSKYEVQMGQRPPSHVLRWLTASHVSADRSDYDFMECVNAASTSHKDWFSAVSQRFGRTAGWDGHAYPWSWLALPLRSWVSVGTVSRSQGSLAGEPGGEGKASAKTAT